MLALVVEVEQVFYHCSKAFLRSHLWEPETWGGTDLREPGGHRPHPRAAGRQPRGVEQYYGRTTRTGSTSSAAPTCPRRADRQRDGSEDRRRAVDRGVGIAARRPPPPGRRPRSTWAPAAPVKVAGSATSASSCSRDRPSRGSAASRSNRSFSAAPRSRMRQRHGDRVLLDGLVGLLAADTVAHRGHQHLGGRQERQVALELARRPPPGRRRTRRARSGRSRTARRRRRRRPAGRPGVRRSRRRRPRSTGRRPARRPSTGSPAGPPRAR